MRQEMQWSPENQSRIACRGHGTVPEGRRQRVWIIHFPPAGVADFGSKCSWKMHFAIYVVGPVIASDETANSAHLVSNPLHRRGS
jgi:hypothetical protein